jgi:hypothetical protein
MLSADCPTPDAPIVRPMSDLVDRQEVSAEHRSMSAAGSSFCRSAPRVIIDAVHVPAS